MTRFIRVYRVAFLLTCFTGLQSCGSRVSPPPIPQDQFIEVLCDIHIVEGALQNRPRDQKDSIAVVYYEGVYEKHQITEADFLTSLEMLEADPKLMSEVYSKVMIRLDTMEQHSYKDKYKKK